MLGQAEATFPVIHSRLPEWIRRETRASRGGRHTRHLLRNGAVHTVCEEASCPNRGKCFSQNRATFLILGDRCTRNCGFCGVQGGPPLPPDSREPERVAWTARELGLKYVVVTSVTRDDLPDNGARQFALTIRELKRQIEGCRVEVLTPDFQGCPDRLRVVLEARPDVFGHNLETVERMYSVVRPGARYRRSLDVLASAKRMAPHVKTKSGLMVGLGETPEEVIRAFRDLRDAGCELLTVGQYLRPSARNLPVTEYVHPDMFEQYRISAERMGFRVDAAPLVRSSMNAEEMTHV